MSKIISMNPNQPVPQQSQVKLNVNDLDDIKCLECNQPFFEEVIKIKRVSPIYTQTGKAELLPIPVLRCVSCGTILEPDI